MKLARPKISANLEDTTVETMVDDGELESALLKSATAINCNVTALQLIDTVVEELHLTGAHFSRIVARDVIFKRSDLSSASLDNGMLVRVEFVNCRMTGIDFSQTNIHDVSFKDCKLDQANFHKADLRRVEFIGCSVRERDLAVANRVDVTFR